MTDSSVQAHLVAAWQAWEAKPSGKDSAAAFHDAVNDFARAHGLSPLFLRSEMTRMRRRRPQPDHAAVLVAILEGTDS